MFCVALTIQASPGTFWLNAVQADVLCAVLAVGGMVRLYQAIRVVRRLHYLTRLADYRVSFSKLPMSRRRLFLGRGFEWTQLHTQRLCDTRSPEARRFLEEKRLSKFLDRLQTVLEQGNRVPVLAGFARKRFFSQSLGASLHAGGKPELHGVEPKERNVYMDLRDRVGHTLVLGTTRVGKTRLAEMLIAQDIRRGDVVIVFDPKGDIGLLRRVYLEAVRAGREERFLFFHLGYPQVSARYNAIGRFSRITEVATRVANQLPSGGSSTAFKEFAWRFVKIIARALVALDRVPNYRYIRKYINDIEPLFIEYGRAILARHASPGWKARLAQGIKEARERRLPSALKDRDPEAVAILKLVRDLQLDDPVMEGLISAFKYDRTYFDKIVSSVGPLMEKLTTGPIAELISPPAYDSSDARPTFDWQDVVRDRCVVYVGLDALSDSVVAGAVGNSMFSDLASLAGHIYKHGVEGEPQDELPPSSRPAICLHADEFNELIGEEFVPLLNKAGGAGFQVTAYTQTWSDVEARLGSRAKTGQVAGNFNTLICLRVKELRTAEMLTDQLPKVNVRSLMQSSSASERVSPHADVDFDSKTEDRVSVREALMLSPSDLMSLPKGQAFVLLDGGHLWKLRFPLACIEDESEPEIDLPWERIPSVQKDTSDIAKEMEPTDVDPANCDVRNHPNPARDSG